MLFSEANPLLLVGCGNMGQALARGWCRSVLDAQAFVVLDRHPGKREAFYTELSSRHYPCYESLLTDCRPSAICLAVKPYQLEDVLPEIADNFAELKPLIMPVIAGRSIDYYATRLWDNAAIVRVMPNTPSMFAVGMSGCIANAQVSSEQRAAADRLMQAVGEVLWLNDEAMMHRLTAISGSGPAYVFYLMECLITAARNSGFSIADARLLVTQTFAGAAAMAHHSEEPISTLREQVTSPGGTTEAGLHQLMDEDVIKRIQTVVDAASARSKELSSE